MNTKSWDQDSRENTGSRWGGSLGQDEGRESALGEERRPGQNEERVLDRERILDQKRRLGEERYWIKMKSRRD